MNQTARKIFKESSFTIGRNASSKTCLTLAIRKLRQFCDCYSMHKTAGKISEEKVSTLA